VLSRLMPPPFQMPGIKRFSLALKGKLLKGGRIPRVWRFS